MTFAGNLKRHAAVFLTGLAVSVPVVAAGVQKIGFINTERIYQETAQAQNIQVVLEQEFRGRQEDLEKLRSEGVALEKKLSAKNLQNKQRDELEKRWHALAQEFRRRQTALEEDYNLRRNEEFASLQQNANNVIVELAKRQGYDVILQDVIYVRSEYDMTDDVIKALNAR